MQIFSRIKFGIKFKQIVFVEEPHQQSYAASFLHKTLSETGDLCCSYCQKNKLIIEEEGMFVPSRKKATIDHVNPISLGGNIYNIENVIVACEECNRLKGNMTLQDFLKNYKSVLNPILYCSHSCY